MQNKWLNLGNRRQQQDGGNGGNHGSQGMNGDATTATPRGDLLMLEDIYRTAGIMEPRMGYSITKVVEMLRSDHLRGLGDEVKRASRLELTIFGGPSCGTFRFERLNSLGVVVWGIFVGVARLRTSKD